MTGRVRCCCERRASPPAAAQRIVQYHAYFFRRGRRGRRFGGVVRARVPGNLVYGNNFVHKLPQRTNALTLEGSRLDSRAACDACPRVAPREAPSPSRTRGLRSLLRRRKRRRPAVREVELGPHPLVAYPRAKAAWLWPTGSVGAQCPRGPTRPLPCTWARATDEGGAQATGRSLSTRRRRPPPLRRPRLHQHCNQPAACRASRRFGRARRVRRRGRRRYWRRHQHQRRSRRRHRPGRSRRAPLRAQQGHRRRRCPRGHRSSRALARSCACTAQRSPALGLHERPMRGWSRSRAMARMARCQDRPHPPACVCRRCHRRQRSRHRCHRHPRHARRRAALRAPRARRRGRQPRAARPSGRSPHMRHRTAAAPAVRRPTSPVPTQSPRRTLAGTEARRWPPCRRVAARLLQASRCASARAVYARMR